MNKIYYWLKENDLPNSIGLMFTAIVWPLALYFWSKRKVSSIPNLTIALGRGNISIGDNPNIVALTLTFINNSNSTIFITNPRIKDNKKNFRVHPVSTKDFNSGYYELKFHDGNNAFNVDNKVLRTNDRALTVIGLSEMPDDTFLNHTSNFFKRIFNKPKYFILQFTALVGNRRYLIKAIH